MNVRVEAVRLLLAKASQDELAARKLAADLAFSGRVGSVGPGADP